MSLPIELADRDPTKDPTPLDRASFYVEELKFMIGDHAVEKVEHEQVVEQMTKLLHDANVTSMTGEELVDAMVYYGVSIARLLGTSRTLGASVFLDGVMHGLALGAGLEAEPRNS